MRIPEIQESKSGKYFQVDFRQIRPLDIAGGNVRIDYEGIPELAESILASGSIDGEKFLDLTADVMRTDWVRVFAGEKKPFAGKFLIGGLNMPLVGYYKLVNGDRLFFTLAGHRRTLACEMLFKEYGIITIVPFVPKDIRVMSEKDIITFMLDENENRRGLSILEQANIASKLYALGTTISEISAHFKRNKDYSYVNGLLRLEKAPDEIKSYIKNGTIAPSNVFSLFDANKSDEDVLKKMNELHMEAKMNSNGAPVKIKAAAVKQSNGTIDSKIEIDRFFRKYRGKNPLFSNITSSDSYDLLEKIHNNKITLTDLEKQFYPI